MIHCGFTRALFALGLLQRGLTSVIQTLDTVDEAVGEDALLSCQILQPEDVVRVTWQKQTLDGEINLATYNNFYGSRVISDFRGKVEMKDGGLLNSSIVIKNVTDEDEGFYLCLFIANPPGALTGRTFLRVYELHEPVLHVRESNSSDEFFVSCSATGRPAPSVTLNVPQQDFSLSQHNTVSVINTDGTFTVTATAVLAGCNVTGKQARCAVQVLSRQKEVFVPIPDVKLMLTTGLDEGSGSASRCFGLFPTVGMLIVAVTCLCAALVFIVLLIRRQRSRDIEKTEIRQTADADTVQDVSSTTEMSQLRKRTPPTELEPNKVSFKPNRILFGL